jgi:hypothetical protein
MKKFICLSFILIATIASALDLTLVWDRNPETRVVGYKVYEVTGTNYFFLGSTTNINFVVTNVTKSAHTWAITAYDKFFESGYSLPASIQGPPLPPTNLTILDP